MYCGARLLLAGAGRRADAGGGGAAWRRLPARPAEARAGAAPAGACKDGESAAGLTLGPCDTHTALGMRGACPCAAESKHWHSKAQSCKCAPQRALPAAQQDSRPAASRMLAGTRPHPTRSRHPTSPSPQPPWQHAREEKLTVLLGALLRRYVEDDAEGFRVRAPGWRQGGAQPEAASAGPRETLAQLCTASLATASGLHTHYRVVWPLSAGLGACSALTHTQPLCMRSPVTAGAWVDADL